MTWKSVWSVVAGVLFIIVVTTLVDVLLHAMNVYPPWGQPMDDRLAMIATSYRIVISVVGAWLTARLAPANPMKHAIILGVVGTVLGGAGAAATWNTGLGPRWYAALLAVLALPQCWLGGWLRVRQTAAKAAV